MVTGMSGFRIEPAPREGGPALVDTLMQIDEEASELYRAAGIILDLTSEHPFVTAERSRWTGAVRDGNVLLAVGPEGEVAGFAVRETLDGAAYLDQLAVRPRAMRNGLGRRLTESVAHRVRAQGERALWLTTYGHLAWNAPFYERLGFVRADEAHCGPELRATLADQRSVLPAPEQRVAMLLTL